MEKQNLIITIGRQYGSGGAEVGKKLGQRMGLDVYDKEILKMTSDESGIRESYFHLADERAGKKLLYKIVQSLIPENTSPSTGSDLVSADNLFRFQSAVIRRLAQEESCIFIGRCADHVLAGTERLVRIFIYADMEARTEDPGKRAIMRNMRSPEISGAWTGTAGLSPVLHRKRMGERGKL